MGFSESALQAIHEVHGAIECVERAAEALQHELCMGLEKVESNERLVEKLMAQRTRLAELACEIEATRPAKRRI
jgi:hypothetical protein